MADPVAIGAGGEPIPLELSMAARHGIVAGATGTGKTVTLQTLVERLSAAGVPVLAADVKGDLSGLAAPGLPASAGGSARIDAALAAAGLSGRPRRGLPAAFWDVYGERGIPLRATVSDMGPLILGRALGLEGVRAEVLSVLFRIADDRGLELVDLKDLRALVDWVSANASTLEADYGRTAPASLAALLRAVVVLEGQGGDSFFGEPALDLRDLMARDAEGRGLVSVLSAERLVGEPSLYAAFHLWLLSELFEELPEAGDPAVPRLAVFFDEAHLLFDGASEELVRSAARAAKLIRSKGVGLWFVTQDPLDLPEEILAQLGNRIQHALRAYSPKEARAVKAAAASFRPGPGLDVEAALGELAVGEAVVSLLDAEGVPAPARRARIVPPLSRVGPLTAAERSAAVSASPLSARYAKRVDRRSAFEALRGGRPGPGAGGVPGRAPADEGSPAGAARPEAPAGDLSAAMADLEAELRGWPRPASRPEAPSAAPAAPSRAAAGAPPHEVPDSHDEGEELLEALARSALRAAGTELGRQLVRGVLGGRSGGARRGRR